MRTPGYYILWGILSFCAISCSKSSSPLPVQGKIIIADVESKKGNIRFVPDKSKGNNLDMEPVGQIADDGTYSVTTGGKMGAPAGHYKVLVFISVPTNPNDPYSTQKSLIHAKYKSADSTDLSIEVVAKPAANAYDLKLSR